MVTDVLENRNAPVANGQVFLTSEPPRGKYQAVTKHWAPITQRRGAISRKNEEQISISAKAAQDRFTRHVLTLIQSKPNTIRRLQ
jgi:hypothetical protein